MTNQIEPVASLPKELATINPEQYAAAVIAPFKAALDKAIAEDVTAYDVTTTAGMKVATTRRAVFREIRVSAEKERVARKAPLLEIGRLLDAKSKEIAAVVSHHEDLHDAAIKAEESRKAAEKAEKERIERERVAAIHDRIAYFSTTPAKFIGSSAADIVGILESMTGQEMDWELYAEFADTAAAARQSAIDKLTDMLAAQQAQEAEQARIVAEREQLARQQAEQRRIEADAAAARLAQEKADRLRREAEEASFRDSMAKQAAAQQAEIQRQKDEAQAQREELERQQEQFRQEQEAARIAALPVIVETPAVDPVKADPVPASRPTDKQIIMSVADRFNVTKETAIGWIATIQLGGEF